MNPLLELATVHKGAVQASLWTVERVKRPIPRHAVQVHRLDVHRLPEPSRTRAAAIIEKHPRTRWIVAVGDWSVVEKLTTPTP